MENRTTPSCARWGELTKLDLYMDQVCIAVGEVLFGVAKGQEAALTPTMVNNYVKLKLLEAPQKKKYSTAHVSKLIIITLLKRVLSLNEIAAVLGDLFSNRKEQSGYDLFGASLEAALCGGELPAECPPLLAAALRSLAGKLEVERILADAQG
ncbi:MAG: DUF1836 domain-containing protein [Clostridia bacterium]|nr:DUF1836 domain-containing protein [Clostridia bacterium]